LCLGHFDADHLRNQFAGVLMDFIQHLLAEGTVHQARVDGIAALSGTFDPIGFDETEDQMLLPATPRSIDRLTCTSRF
jgi:hypothetical protein